MRGAPPPVVAALLRAAPRAASQHSTSRGWLPHHCAAAAAAPVDGVMELLLQACPEGAKAQDHLGLIPLHHANENKAGVKLVGLLSRAFPDGKKQLNPRGWRK